MNTTASATINVDVSVHWTVHEIWRLIQYDNRTARLLCEPVPVLNDAEWGERIGCPAFVASQSLRVLENMGLIEGSPL